MTWGVFPGQEIAQSTIIEKESFLAWKVGSRSHSGSADGLISNGHLQEEAFGIWEDWASYYPPESEARRLLDGVRERRWLVSIVHHDYKNPDALWTFLFENGPLV